MIKKIKYKCNLVQKKLLFNLGFSKQMLKNRYGERILVYHGIDKVGSTKYNTRFISKDYFEEQIKYFSKNFNVISIDDFYNKKFKKGVLNVCITFDDGYLNNYEYAVPILKKYNAPATFFITTIKNDRDFLWPDFIDLVNSISTKTIDFNGFLFSKNGKKVYFNKKLGVTLKQYCITLEYDKISQLFEIFEKEWKKVISNEKLDDYWKLMDFKHIVEISNDNLFTIGSHSKYHSSFKHITEENMIQELKYSKFFLENLCKSRISAFAYPYGNYSYKSNLIVKDLGFDKILLVDYNNKKDKSEQFLKDRFGINPFMSWNYQLVSILKGSY